MREWVVCVGVYGDIVLLKLFVLGGAVPRADCTNTNFRKKRDAAPKGATSLKKPHRAVYRTFRNPACGKAAPYPSLYCSQRPRYANIDVFSGRSANHVGICFGFLYSIVGFNTRYHALSRKQITITWTPRRSRSPGSECHRSSQPHRRTHRRRRW